MIYFISDVHLGIYERKIDIDREDILLELLAKIKEDAEELYILGDLFDYWFEYKTVVPKFFFRTIYSLYEIRKKGIEITYLMGNHDFGHRDFFSNEFGIEIVKDDITKIIKSKKFYLSHGDGKAYNDGPYLLIKKITRSPFSQKMFNLLHPDFGIKLASSSSKTSRSYTDKKDYGPKDGMEDFAKQKLETEGYDYVIMGHRHKVIRKKFGNGEYINLGDWLSEPMVALFDGLSVELITVKEFMNKGN